ncbi:MAG TPA: uroporphyrinogen decarboxylase family protein [Oscillospiraceae bacterium]|nr:uroporphyrinogen decarboxylase family protein [Oscillospiraceae bacterium]
MTTNPQKLAAERAARIKAAYDLQEPDRVPFTGMGGDVVASFAGITGYQFNFDYELANQAVIKYLQEFSTADQPVGAGSAIVNNVTSLAFLDFPDLAAGLAIIDGPINDILGVEIARFPGRELPENSSSQFIGNAYMKPEEYDQLIADPLKFLYETVMTRSTRSLANLGSPASLAAMARYGMERAKKGIASQKFGQELQQLGYPGGARGMFIAPLDFIGDQLRDIPNLIKDLRRYPDKTKAAAKAMLEPLLRLALGAKNAGADLAFIPLHLNEYLSPKLYNEFYWPTLKEGILRMLQEGMKSQVFFEGRHDPHMETILELPAGWGAGYFEKTDVRKAKKLLQGHTCIIGGLDVGMVIASTPAKLDEYIKELLGEMMPGGGFILAPNVGNLPRETPIENIRAVYEAVEKYGKY